MSNDYVDTACSQCKAFRLCKHVSPLGRHDEPPADPTGGDPADTWWCQECCDSNATALEALLAKADATGFWDEDATETELAVSPGEIEEYRQTAGPT